jgi:NitT/TauT family transport system substrate-binding protein
VACVARAGGQFEYSKYSGWPEVKEVADGRAHPGAYMLAPLVMDPRGPEDPAQDRLAGPPLRRGDHGARAIPDHELPALKGKRVAIPSRFAVDFLFLRRMLAKEGMTPKDVELIEMAARHAGRALREGGRRLLHGRALRRGRAARRVRAAVSMTRDEWRRYICCVLTVREELIAENRPLVQDLVNYVLARACGWTKQANRDKAVTIASGRKFFNQDPNIIQVRDGEIRPIA